jgi:hypothetical protein
VRIEQLPEPMSLHAHDVVQPAVEVPRMAENIDGDNQFFDLVNAALGGLGHKVFQEGATAMCAADGE